MKRAEVPKKDGIVISLRKDAGEISIEKLSIHFTSLEIGKF